MAIPFVGLQKAKKKTGATASGQRWYIVHSDAQITENIDTILDATGANGGTIPEYDSTWGGDDTNNLRVTTKDADAYDVDNDIAEGYWWRVSVMYEPPDFQSGQEALDPADRDWIWAVEQDKQETTIVSSLFDTAGYIYPGSIAANMENLANGKAITNTAGEPPEEGVLRTISRSIITLTKYVADPTDIGLTAAYSELQQYVDTVNDAAINILDFNLAKWECLMDDISWEPISENGFERVKITFRIIVDTFFTHVFSFPSSGFNQIVDATYERVKNSSGEDSVNPRLLNKDGKVIPLPAVKPFVLDPIYVSCGINSESDWSALSLPTSIP